jgi:hypothetical protein
MAAKSTHHLDPARLAEFLAEKGLIEVEVIRELLKASNDGGAPFAEALVEANLITDWDLSRAVCETFHLPFLPVENAKPRLDLISDLDPAFLSKHGLVPLQRFGSLLTVVMPGIVPAETLAELSAMTDLTIMPIVGTVEGNRLWLGEHCKVEAVQDGDWGSLFDEGDANVQLSLDDTEGEASTPIEALAAELEEDLGSLEYEEHVDDVPSIAEVHGAEADEAANGPVELPPMPEFGSDG